MKSRMQYTMLNLKVSFAVQPFRILFGFVNRTIFITTLGVTYLSLSNLLTSILSFLSLAELGVGAAMSYALYKPLANKNHGKVTAYMQLFQKLYRLIGVSIFVLGTILSFFLSYFIKGQVVTQEVISYYFLFLINSVVSYFFVYKRTLIEADQKKYKVIVIDFFIFLLGNMIQIILLLLTKNYYLYLLCTIFMTIVGNLVISYIVNNEYPYILESEIEELTKSEKKSFVRNIKGMMVSNIGETVVFGIDNILLSSFISLTMVGIYSNYTYLLGVITGIISLFMTSSKSSIANLVYDEASSTERVIIFLRKYQATLFMIVYLISIGSLLFINPVIEMWLGKDYLFDMQIVLVILIYFFINVFRSIFTTLIGVFGLYYEQNIKTICEIILNVVFSIGFLLWTDLGIIAILCGTILSSLLTVVWYEPYSVFKHGIKYFDKVLIKRMVIDYVVGIISLLLLYLVEVNYLSSLSLVGGIIYRSVIYVGIFIIFSIVSYKNEDYKFIINLLKRFMKFKRN